MSVACSLYLLGAVDQTQAPRLSYNHLHLLNHLTGPLSFFLSKEIIFPKEVLCGSPTSPRTEDTCGFTSIHLFRHLIFIQSNINHKEQRRGAHFLSGVVKDGCCNLSGDICHVDAGKYLKSFVSHIRLQDSVTKCHLVPTVSEGNGFEGSRFVSGS